MTSLSRHTCLLSHSQDIEFGAAPDRERTATDPFRAYAIFRMTISSCTPLGQRSPLVQLSAPIPLAADLNPNPDSSALPKSSTSEESMPPPPKRQRPDDSIAAPEAPVAAVHPPVVAPPSVEEPLAEEPLVEASAGEVANVLSPLDLSFVVFGNDTDEGKIIKSVLSAPHSRRKPEKMLQAAFPGLSVPQITQLVDMPCFDVFCHKKGGLMEYAIADAKKACRKLIELADEHGSALRVWGCGGAMDRIVQISSLTGFVQADNMRPLSGARKPSAWAELGIRSSECVSGGKASSINLTSSSDGTGTYRFEIWRNDECATHFFLGVYPHPGCLSWGAVESRPHEHAKFLRDLANGTPSQEHVIKINADEFP